MSFLDLFPDSQAAVVGSQGTRDILENQYKQSMSAMDMENALLKSVMLKKQFDESQRMEPLTKTLDAVKLLQGINLKEGKAYGGLDFNDLPGSMNRIIQEQAGSGGLMSNVEVELAKAKEAGLASLARAQITSGVSQTNNDRDNAQNNKKLLYEAAEKAVGEQKLIPRNGKIRIPSDPQKAANLRGQVESFLQAYPGTPAADQVRRLYGPVFGGAAAPKAGAPDTAKKPAIIKIGNRTFQKVNGTISEVK